MMRHGAVWVGGLAMASLMSDQALPPQLSAIAAKAHVEGAVVAWCQGEFRSGRPGAFAVAASGRESGGRYLALEADATVHELGTFVRRADLACYSRAEARKLTVALGESATIHGHLAPRWNTTVVCGFTDDTTAVCWQYSPADDRFVKVGGWVT